MDEATRARSVIHQCIILLLYFSKSKSGGLQSISETCYDIWFEDGGADKKTGGGAGDGKIFIGRDQNGQD